MTPDETQTGEDKPATRRDLSFVREIFESKLSEMEARFDGKLETLERRVMAHVTRENRINIGLMVAIFAGLIARG